MEERLLQGGQPADFPPSGTLSLSDRVKAFVDERIYQPFMGVIKSRITPEKLALSLSLGIICGLWPIPFTTALLCLLATFLFRVNKVVAQIVNLVLAPVELLCIPFFYKVGAYALGSDPIPFSAKEMVEQLRKDFFGTLGVFGDVLFRSMLGWLLLSIPITLLCYGALLPAMRKGGPNAAYQTMDADVEGSFMLDDDDVPSGHEVPGESGLHRGPQSHTALNL